MADRTTFLAPSSLDEAVALAADEDSILLSGGTAVGVLLRQGVLDAGRLVWLGRIDALHGVADGADGSLRVGAATTMRELASHPTVAARHPMLAAAARSVGNARVRAVATVGGALAHADPRQDLLPALLASGASVDVVGPAGPRRHRLADGFFRGFLDASLDEGEIVAAVELPDPTGSVERYLRFTPASLDDYPTVSVAARWRDGGPTGGELTVALGGVGSTPVLAWGPGDGAVGPADDVGARAAILDAVDARVDPSDDRRGSADYKAAMARLWTERVLDSLTR